MTVGSKVPQHTMALRHFSSSWMKRDKLGPSNGHMDPSLLLDMSHGGSKLCMAVHNSDLGTES